MDARQKWCQVSDNDGHDYIIEFERQEYFYHLLDKLEACDYEDQKLMDEFDEKFEKGRTIAQGVEYFYLDDEQVDV